MCKPVLYHTVQPAFEDGTDTGFRNVGQIIFDVGEIPRRKYTTVLYRVSQNLCHNLFLVIPHPQLSKKVPINIGLQ